MRCQNCNNDNVNEARFCAFCGATLTAPKQPPPFPSQPIPQPQLKLTSIQRPAVVTLIAVLQFIACGVMLLGFVGFIYVGVKEEKIVFDIVGSILFIFAILHFFAGLGLWHLQPYGRKLQLVLAYLGLLSIPIGTIISILILVYLHKPEIKLLFSGKTASQLDIHETQLLQKFYQPPTTSPGALVAIIIGVFFVGVMIIGIISAIAIPNWLHATQRAKQKRTMEDIRTIAVACEAYAVDHEMYPDAKSIKELRPLIVPVYLQHFPEKDAWDRTFAYQAWARDGSQKGPTSYMIVSFGKDGVVDSEHYLKNVITTSFNNDIVYSDGSFWQYPEHSQP